MQRESIDAIEANPRYQELVRSRKRFAWVLTLLMLSIYYGFILTIAFAPELLAIPVAEGAIMTIGMPLGVIIILSAFLLTGIYVARANGHFDRLTKEIQEEAR
ncbi:membrane protein [Marichromatium purpuratum 984]|uniref:Membrane protein n=1 Tax=Marichromatium purpuratum 984 TaxID=765910 RepID=W0E2M3_MARPU|nr:DUF485 domain-containing protein [Marichromatium purpuratum]AHF03331.1 membrane protein [Marichromatium purpuratum 984]